MKKILYTLLILFTSINAFGYAQQEASTITEWDGSSTRIRMRADSLITFSYKATENGTLYIYADNQNVSDNVYVSIWGGWYHDGAYDTDSPLQEAGAYENGVGVYGWIKVFAGDEIRFTLSTPEETEGVMAMFTLKSLFFDESVKGGSWEEPIALEEGSKVALPVYKNNETDYLSNLNYATFCRFVAPNDGVANILTKEYLIYYIEEELYGNIDEPLKYASQGISTDDHEFVVKKDKSYIVIIPNRHPTNVTFKMASDRLGENCKAPIELTEFPATLNLMKGNNFYHIDLNAIGEKYIMEMTTKSGWKGDITYFKNCDYESEELAPANISGAAANYILNLDPLYLNDELIINVEVTDVESVKEGVVLNLREPKESESFDKAKSINVGTNAFSGPARDYWFVYTADKAAEISVASSGSIKHMLYSRYSGNIINEYNVYRISEDQTLYICIAAEAGDNSITLTEKAIVAGDYCDYPIMFSLGEDIVIKDRGDNISNYRQFTAEGSGFAILETTSKNVIDNHWSIHFREDCDSKTITYVSSDVKDNNGDVTSRTYKIPVMPGESYIVEIMSFANNGEDIIFNSRFEEAKEGAVCATAIEFKQLGDTITIDNTPESTIWHKYIADKTGFYTTYAKLGRGSNLKVKVGDCDAEESNASDDNRYNNAYMAGYKVCKVYIEEGQTLFIGTTINSEPGDVDGTNYYIVTTFAEARPGERFADPIAAEIGVPYTLTTGTEGYETWYTYTLPANVETTITISSSTMKCYSSLFFYVDEKTSLSAYKKDFAQTNIVNEEGAMIGKSYLFAASEEERTIFIKVPVATIAEPVTWQILKYGDDNGEGEGVDKIQTDEKGSIIYDLMGRKVTHPTRGIYIKNGRKIVIY